MKLKIKDVFNFTRKEKYPYAYFTNNKVIATNGFVCLVSDLDYPTEYENTFRDKQLKEYHDIKFPNYNYALIDKDTSIEVEFNKDYFLNIQKYLKNYSEEIADSRIKIQIKLNSDTVRYISKDVLDKICKYLKFFSPSKLLSSSKNDFGSLQFESYKSSIFDSQEVESQFVFSTTKNVDLDYDLIWTWDNKIHIEDFSYANKFTDMEKVTLNESGLIDLAFMDKYFKKYNLPDVHTFRDPFLEMISSDYTLDINRFDQWLHKRYGNYEVEGKSLNDMFNELFGKDAKTMASFFKIK